MPAELKLAGDPALAEAIHKLHRLPSPRGAALELLRLSRDENVAAGEVARVAQADPALAARLIHAANSVARGAAPKSGSIRDAVLRLGFAATRQIALGFSLVNEYRRGECSGFDYDSFWAASLLRGLAARAIAARLSCGDPQEALACGLLAGIGRLALATAQPLAYCELLDAHGQDGARLRGAERARFGIDHGALGASLLGQWEVPAGLVAAVAGSFAPPLNADGPDRSVRRLTWTLVLAEAVARAATVAAGQREAWTHLALEAAARMDAGAELLEEVTSEVACEAQSWAPLLKLPVPVLVTPDFPGYAHGGTAGEKDQDPAGLDILLVDDDESDRLLGGQPLEKAGHRVRAAASAEDAIALIAEATPQLLITDLDMPAMDGLVLCRTLRESRLGAGLYIIAMTGRERHEDLVECIHAGANDFVGKSATPEVLLARVRAATRTVRSRESLREELDVARNFATGLAIERRRSGSEAGRV